MMSQKTLELLIIEDDQAQVNSFKNSIDLFNRENKDFNFSTHIKRNFIEGMKAISKGYYDTAIIDLKLSTTSKTPEGNKIIKKITDDFRFPIIVRSAYPEVLDEELEEQRSPFLKVYKRGEKTIEDILNEIVGLYKTGITRILGEDGLIKNIEKHLHKIFWNHISKSFEDIRNSCLDTKNVLMRYIMTHLIEYLSFSGPGLPQKHYPGEMYIIPPMNEDLFTGVLLKDKNAGNQYIILMPACDMVVRKDGAIKAEYITMVQIEETEKNHLKQIRKKIATKSNKEEYIKAIEKLNRLLTNSFSLNYHFLPPVPNFEGGFINFRKLKSLKPKEIKKQFKIIGKVTTPFLKDIIARFSTYYARQGQPEFEMTQICDALRFPVVK
ncbi:MAG: hypothetical protein PVH61_01505 [Candidatus Aminicenantes bacterium]